MSQPLGMKVFYRYLRPIKLNLKRMEFETLPHGGVCLRLEEDLDGSFWFTHSRCRSDDYFNKKVAKQIADQRAEVARSDPRLKAACGGLPFTENTENLAIAVAYHCKFWVPPEHTHHVIMKYMQTEWHGLSAAIEQILYQNGREKSLAQAYMMNLASSNLVARYTLGKI